MNAVIKVEYDLVIVAFYMYILAIVAAVCVETHMD
jgi:hypothetical protein